MKRRDAQADERVFPYRITSSSIVLTEKLILQELWTGAQKDIIATLGEARSSLFKNLKQVAPGKAEVSVRSEMPGKCFPLIASPCCEVLQKKNTSTVLRGYGRRRLCAKRHNTYKNIMKGMWSPSSLVV